MTTGATLGKAVCTACMTCMGVLIGGIVGLPLSLVIASLLPGDADDNMGRLLWSICWTTSVCAVLGACVAVFFSSRTFAKAKSSSKTAQQGHAADGPQAARG